MKVSILTLGCKVNQAEMTEVESALKGQGHEIVRLGENPDVCVINTCTVTSKSDYQSRQLIRRAGRTGARVIATGCYAELNPDKVGAMDGVKNVVSNINKTNIINLINNNTSILESGTLVGRARYFLKVQDGCDNSCSYCIVHVARGRSRSENSSKIIKNLMKAVDGGYEEAVLTGIHLGQYGRDLTGDVSISTLVSELLDKTEIKRLRLSSLEVNEIDGRLLDLFKNPRLMPHLHVPLQSGDDGVLKLMNRGYNTSLFKEKILKIKQRVPNAALGTDVIAGFPQESKKAFKNTYSLCDELPFSYMHVFPYSRRPGTLAASMEDIVGADERKKRASTLRELGHKKKTLFMEGQIGKTLYVLMEESIKRGLLRGTSCNYLKVQVPCEARKRGSIVPVRIAGIREGTLVGELE